PGLAEIEFGALIAFPEVDAHLSGVRVIIGLGIDARSRVEKMHERQELVDYVLQRRAGLLVADAVNHDAVDPPVDVIAGRPGWLYLVRFRLAGVAGRVGQSLNQRTKPAPNRLRGHWAVAIPGSVARHASR